MTSSKVASGLRVKVCGMRDTGNIRGVSALHPDMMGFIFVKTSPRFVGEGWSVDALSDLAPSITKVGVFADQSTEHILGIVQRYGLQSVQLHGSEGMALITELRRCLPHLSIFKALKVEKADDLTNLRQFDDVVDCYVLDNSAGGTGQKFEWSVLKEYTSPRPFLLAGGIGVGDVAKILEVRSWGVPLQGIDINSRVEIEPGMKDLDKVRAVMREVRV